MTKTKRYALPTKRVREPVDPPVTLEDLLRLFARGLDEGPYVSRMLR